MHEDRVSQRNGRRGGSGPPRRHARPTAGRPRTLAATALAILALGGCGGSASSGSAPKPAPPSASSTVAPARSTLPPAGGLRVVSGTAGDVTASMHAGTHRPKVGRNWPVRFIVTRGGQFVQASVSYEFLLAGQVVARRSHYTFHGRFHDIVNWPASAVGYPLTLRAVIESGGATINLDYPLQVSR